MQTPIDRSDLFARDLIASAENQLQSGIESPESWLVEALGGGSNSSSGVPVNTTMVLGLPAAWRSIDLVSSQLGKMPAEVHRRSRDGAFKPIPDHPVERLLNRMCGALYTPFTLRQTMTIHALLEGNGRAFILRDPFGNPQSLTLMMPKQTYTIVINGEKFHVVFFTRDQYGDVLTPQIEEAMGRYGDVPIRTGNGSFFTIPDKDVLHIPGLSYNGLWGVPLIYVARDAFGTDGAAHDAIAYQFRNGGRPGLLLTAPRGLFPTEKQAREFMAQFRSKHEGTENTGKTGLLREGMTAQMLQAQNTFAGLSDLNSASKSDIALLFGTEYLLGEVSAVYKDLQSRMTAFYQNTLDKWAETWEQECGRKLLNRGRYETGSLRVHLDPTAILRGTPNELADYTGKLRTQGLISGNEGRDYHSLPPVDELNDDYGNPAISTPNDDDTETETDNEPADDSETENRAQRAISRHFKSMIGHECRRVLQASETESGFFDRVESFYEGFETALAELCEDLLIDVDQARRHCEQSKQAIFEVAGVAVGVEQLQAEMKRLVFDWESRYETFTDVPARETELAEQLH
jgi:HK97 family phage portal protein